MFTQSVRFGVTLALLLLSCAEPAVERASALAEPKAAAAPALFEPKGSRILHLTGGTVGQYDVPEIYSRALGPELAPVGDSIWMDIPGTRSWPGIRGGLQRALADLKAKGWMVNLNIGFDNGRVRGFSSSADKDVAETTQHDAQIDDLARLVRDSGVPTFLRIGGELNADWEGHHPFVFPLAYRKIVERFRAAGCDRVAYVWCVEPHGEGNLGAVDAYGRAKWWPGEDVIDWYGIDVFQREHFDPRAPLGGRQAAGKRLGHVQMLGVTEELLAMARKAGKPVLLGECSPFQVNVPTAAEDPDGTRVKEIWSAWFEPFVAFLDRNPEIKAVAILPVDWSVTRNWPTWGDSRIQDNPRLLELWKKELSKPRWVKAREFPGGVYYP